jgi:hypothetical protein
VRRHRPHRSQLAPLDAAARLVAVAICCGFTSGCATLDELLATPTAAERPVSKPTESLPVTEVYARADDDRTAELEREVERLRADLTEAEESLIAIESGLRGIHGRADAVSALAEARIEVERAARKAPWAIERLAESHRKLAEAERQFQADHTGTAVFFASRARRIANALNDEARKIAGTPGMRFIRGRRVNLRAGPSTSDKILSVLVGSTPVVAERSEGDWSLVRTTRGSVGWIHESLLRKTSSTSSQTKTQSLPASLAR